MSLLLCAATAQEMTALLPAAAGKVGVAAAEGGFEEMRLYPLRLKGGEALCCVTGVGPLNAGLAMGLALGRAAAEAKPVTAVLNAGLAGAFDLHGLPLGTLCLVREEIWPEYGLHDGRSVTAEAFGFPLWQRPAQAAEAPRPVYDRLPLDGLQALGAGAAKHEALFTPCRSLTVAGVTAGFDRARALWERYRAELENMEGFAAAYACARQGIPCVEIRSVSNKVGPRGKDEKDFPGALQRLGGILPALNLL